MLEKIECKYLFYLSFRTKVWKREEIILTLTLASFWFIISVLKVPILFARYLKTKENIPLLLEFVA